MRVLNYGVRHIQAALNSLGQFSRLPVQNLLTCLVIAIALVLPTGFYVLMNNVRMMSHDFQQTAQLTLYLKKPVTENQVMQLNATLQKNPAIASAAVISPQQGLNTLQQQLGLTGVLASVTDNPLPWAITIIPKLHADGSLDQLTAALAKLDLVDTLQFDSLWMQRLSQLLILGNRFAYLLLVFFSLAVLLIVNNSIRAATQSNYHEIDVIRLIGGTDAFIRRPFLYTGGLYGLVGAVLAWQLINVFLFFIQSPVAHLSALYENAFTLTGLGWMGVLALLSGGLVLGLLGAAFAVTRYLARV